MRIPPSNSPAFKVATSQKPYLLSASNMLPAGRSLSSMWQNYWIPEQQTNTSPGVSASQLINESTGLLEANAGYNVSALVPVTPGEIIVWWNDQQEILAPNKGGFYASNGTTWIGGVHANGIYAGHRCLFRVPAGASYVRMNVNRATNPARKYWLGRRRSQLRKGPAESFTFAGDSLTAGSTVYFNKTFPQVITDITGIPHTSTAVGGRRISGASTGLHVDIRTNNHIADIGIMLGGVNDYLNNVTLGDATSSNTAEFNGALNAMCSYLVNGRPWQKWYLVTPLPQNSLNPNAGGLSLRDYCDAVIAAGLRYGITVIDANRDLGLDLRQTYQGWMFGGDTIHLNWLSTDLVALYMTQKIFHS